MKRWDEVREMCACSTGCVMFTWCDAARHAMHVLGFWPLLRHAETVYHTDHTVAVVMQFSCWKIWSQTKDSRFNATAFEFWVNKCEQVTNRPASHSSIPRYQVVWMCETVLWWWTLMFGDPGYRSYRSISGQDGQADKQPSSIPAVHLTLAPPTPRPPRVKRTMCTELDAQVNTSQCKLVIWSCFLERWLKTKGPATVYNKQRLFVFCFAELMSTSYLRAENWRQGVSETVHESCKDMNTMYVQSCAYVLQWYSIW